MTDAPLADARPAQGAAPGRALRFAAFGGPEVLEVVAQDPPAIGAEEALVAVRAASINPSDVKNVAGRMRQTVPPRIPGRDFAGVVAAGPADWIGAEVWGTGGDVGFTRDGTHGAWLRLPVAALARKPANLSFEQAASVGVNYVTALIGLDYAALQEGETLVVIGASGGVGGAACAIARGRGARVIAALRGAPVAGSPAALATGEAIDLEQPGFGARVMEMTGGKGADVTLDCVGRPDLIEGAIDALGFRGRLVLISGTPGQRAGFEPIPFYRRECRMMGVDSLKRGVVACAPMMEVLRQGFESGAFPPPSIAHAFPLDAAREAYATVAAGSRGRIVLTMG